MVAKGGGVVRGREMELFNGYRVLVLQGEKSSGMDDGHGFTILNVVLIPLNCKNGGDSKFCNVYLSTIFKMGEKIHQCNSPYL